MSRATTLPKSELNFLVVDDDEEARGTLVEYLKSHGCGKVHEASSAIDALSLMERSSVDFIFSDWEMPGLSGLELLRTLRADERWKGLPFVMVTAPISHENLKIEQAATLEVDAYIIKPFRAKILMEKIEEALDECREREKKAALVIDDDPEVRKLMVEMLQVQDFKPIFEANDGAEGFDLLNRNSVQIAIVVCDWEMPNKSGIELLQEIRIDRDLAATPFLMVTSQTSIEHLKLQKAIEADVDHYLLKPFVYAEFEKKVRYVIEKARVTRLVNKKIELARKAGKQGDSHMASILYSQAIQLDPKSIDAYLGLAHTKIQTSTRTGFDECIQMIKLAIKLNPKLDRSYIALAHAFEKGFSLEKGVEMLKEGIRSCPPSPQLHYEAGRLLHQVGKFDEALAQLQKALELQPDFPEANSAYANALLRAKNS